MAIIHIIIIIIIIIVRPGVEDLVAAAAGLGLGGVVVALRHHVVGRPVDLRRHACI